MSHRRHPVVPLGTDIGGHTVEAKLGAGGFGAVYRTRRGGRSYALKLIPLWGLAEWAEREVAILLRLKHSNLVRIRGHGQWPDESPHSFFIVMDFVEGRRLDVWAREENPSGREVLLQMLGVARGLGAAHRAKVVHRDLKESNIVVRASDGEAVVVDFGAGGYESAPRITGGVLPPGTPEYRAPEAWRFQQEHGDEPGRSYQPRPSDDLYALGVVIYWLLTGKQPFLPDEAEGVEAVLNRAPKPPHVLNPRVPEALSAVCMRLLAKEPEERHSDAEALCAELEALLAQADEFWDVKLCDAYGPDTATTIAEVPHAGEDELVQWLKKRKARPRRGPRPPTEDAAHDPESSAAAIQAELPPPLPARPAPPHATPQARAGHFNALRVATWIGLLVVLNVCALVIERDLRPSPDLAARHGLEPHLDVAVDSPPASPGFDLAPWAPDQEVAAPWLPLEAHAAAAARDGAPTLAAVAIPATFSQEKASVKMKKNTGMFPEPEPQRLRGGAVGKALGLGVAACMAMACPGPQVRPTPPPEDCPPGAVEAMEELGLFTREKPTATFDLRPQDARNIKVREGTTTVRMVDDWGRMPPGTLFSGQLLVGPERVYGRLTEARTPKNERIPVCVQFVDDEGGRIGLQKRGFTSDSGAAFVYSTLDLKAVRRFE
ncbi:serine/threonine protein kinase [Corallococcus praedator]|uniref:non-specific serine/threonine protein kinase n=1 Tax=Corallococcus praedator TaxID=2316724 RepID=A0ABX9QQD9_9BACT|nr:MULTISPECIES: serine/threonine-protein kinase [Corallococcus]RKH36366.1 serine/threonine protein kinase [Corallococcus sp. CA031C]RKI16582.1 serine/threonine protein kinase [Corallococcus praedator]